MGWSVGRPLGCGVGTADGSNVGTAVGCKVGAELKVGALEGMAHSRRTQVETNGQTDKQTNGRKEGSKGYGGKEIVCRQPQEGETSYLE